MGRKEREEALRSQRQSFAAFAPSLRSLRANKTRNDLYLSPMLRLLDIFYTFLHLLIIGFNLFGWIWPKTRKAHLIVAGITLASWFILGIWYGWGYCPITAWQWNVKEKLGETDLPNSFIKYFADKITGHDFPPSLVDTVTLISFLAAIILSLYFNFSGKRITAGKK